MVTYPLMDALAGLNADSADVVLDRFVGYAAARGLQLYSAQEEAVLELVSGKHVILTTPTGSGKSLVATAMIFRTMAAGGRSFYTCPIKALVSEKFFNLCQDFGPERVGMMTGDASINRDAPIICCTAEVLMNMALRQGDDAGADAVIMDEFHYYTDRERGVAWQVPLLLLEKTRFLLMSATLGNPEFFADVLKGLTGVEASIVRSGQRPVPLDFTYAETPLHETVERLLHDRKAPIYLVNFTQKLAAEEAQNLMSVNVCSREEKQAIHDALKDFRFDTPYGKELQRFVRHGIGIHHAGLLPKYRLMVEKLSQQGLLKVISGTDTLGVGVNIPIRTVLFTRLCKFDGQKTVILSVREFKQIAGRAGRKGFDDAGSVVVQAPEHAIENLRIEAKKAADPGKHKKLQKAKPPEKGYVHWDRQTFERLVERPPEDLQSRFSIGHGMLLQLIMAAPAVRGGGYGRLVTLVARSHQTDRDKQHLRRHAAVLFRSLRNAGIIRTAPVPMMARGRFVEMQPGFQKDFSLHHALGLFLLETLPALDVQADSYALDVLSLVESILENPDIILLRQMDKLKKDAMARMKAEGMEFDKRIEELDKITHPKPNADFIYERFNAFAEQHPWVGRDNIRPKGVAREMFEQFLTFHQFIRDYELQRSEGLLLRYLSDVYKALAQSVPDRFKDDRVLDLVAFLRVTIRGVDSSLVDEWESLRSPEPAGPAAPAASTDGQESGPTVVDLGVQTRMRVARIRTEMHRLMRALALGDFEDAVGGLWAGQTPWTPERLDALFKPYVTAHGKPRLDHEARGTAFTRIEEDGPRQWRVRQVLLDDEGPTPFFLEARVDLQERTGAEGPLLTLESLGQ
jgi:superfamily II RNA helicase